MAVFSGSQLEAIADALGHTDEGLTGTDIGFLLSACKIADPSPQVTKRIRLYNAFVHDQNARQDRTRILGFIRKAMKPERFLRDGERYEPLRTRLNQALVFAGLAVDETGALISVEQATTLTDARRRADELRADLVMRRVHPDVLKFCRDELLVDNYFHAVLEAVKSVMDKVRQRSSLTDDGSALVDKALGGDNPRIAINSLSNENEWSEQKGFANLLRGICGMFRNTTAHAPRAHWAMSRDDAVDLLSLVSLVHRRLDAARP